MICLWVDTISLTSNAPVIMHKDVRCLVNKFTHNTSLVVIPYLWIELILISLKNRNHPPYLWQNLILFYLIKVIKMLALMTKQILPPYLKTMWYHTCGCANKYRFVPAIYLLSCLALWFSIIIEIAVVKPGHVKDVVDGLNARYKWMLKLEMENLFSP